MKVKILAIICCALCQIGILSAQTGINYQAIARDTEGNPISGSVTVDFTIRSGSITGTVVYSEGYTTSTNTYGLVNLVVGAKNPAVFQAVDWSNGPFFLEVAINNVSVGNEELQFVPHSLHADNASGIGNVEVDLTGITDGDILIYSAGAGQFQAGSDVGIAGANNGLSVTGVNVGLGGTLTGTTIIDGGTYDLAFNNVGEMTLTSNGIMALNSSAFEFSDENAVFFAGIDVTNQQIQFGTGSKPAQLRFVDGNQAAGKILTSDISGSASWQDLTETDPEIGAMTLNRVPFWNGTALVAGTVYDNGTNVGIGVTGTPTTKLEVYSSSTSTAPLVEIDNPGTGDASLRFKSGSLDYFTIGIDDSDLDKFKISDNTALGSSDRFVITESGNIGLGTSTPVNKLDVEGGVAIGSSYSGTSTGATNGLIVQGYVGIGSNNPSNPVDINANYAGYAVRLDQANTSGDGILAYINTTSSTRTIFSAQSNTSGFVVKGNGTVGIGTTTPNSAAAIEIETTKTYGLWVDQTKATGTTHGVYVSTGNSTGTDYGLYISGDEANVLDSRLTINGNHSSGYTLYIYGNAWATGGTWGSSDKRLKKDIISLGEVSNRVMQLNPVEYNWRVEDFKEYKFDKEKHVGFIAQEVEELFPLLVQEDEEGYKAINYSQLTPYLTKAVQEQQELIELLNERIIDLETQVSQFVK